MSLATKLKNSGLSGLFLAPRDPRALAEAARDGGLKLVCVDLAGIRDKAGLLGTIARALEFPDWFGRNWDALQDCVTDLSWIRADGYVVVFEHSGGFIRHAPGDFAAMRGIFANAAESWRSRGKPFWVLFDGVDTPIPGVASLV